MSQPAKLQEPTMEEILASIRRIIADDDLRPPPPPPGKPAPAEAAPAAPVPAAGAPAPRDEIADGFDDPEVSNVAANDVFEQRETFEQRESPWRPGEFASSDSAAEEALEPARPEPDRDAGRPLAFLDPSRFASLPETGPPEPGPPEPTPLEPARAPRDPPRPPIFGPFKSEAAKAEFAWLELARSEFAKAEAAKSDVARPDHAKPDMARPDLAKPDLAKPDLARPDLARHDFAKPELPKFDLPRRAPPRWESARPEFQESARPEATGPEPTRSEPTRSEPPRPPVLRAADEGLLSQRTSAAVDLAFNTLAQTVLVQNARTLEDLVREMLKPMLKAWLDDNLPGLVERLVRAEIERVSRGRS